MTLLKIVIYCTATGKEPYSAWEDNLDKATRATIKTRLDRIRTGNLGDAKIIKNGAGVWEMRVDYGPGYRIYFGKQTNTIVVLLIGGDKKSQDRDIAKAKRYWLEYKDL
jgi:putative addiction module killer protein